MGMTRNIISDELREIMKRAKEGKPLLSEEIEQIEKEQKIPPLSKKPKEVIKVTD
jgi:hypothetical protein